MPLELAIRQLSLNLERTLWLQLYFSFSFTDAKTSSKANYKFIRYAKRTRFFIFLHRGKKTDAELSYVAMYLALRLMHRASHRVSSRDNLATTHERGSSSFALKIYLGHSHTLVVFLGYTKGNRRATALYRRAVSRGP